MLKVYRRHKQNCKHRGEDRDYRRCSCPVWTDGTLGHKRVLKSLNMRDWESALETARDWELANQESTTEDISVATATAGFLADATATTKGLHRNFELQGGVRNLLGRRYQDPLSQEHLLRQMPAPGRTAFVKLIWQSTE